MKNDEAYDIYFKRRTPRDTIAAGLRDYQRDWGEMDPPFDREWWEEAGATYPPTQRPWNKFDELDLITMVEQGRTDREISAVLRRSMMSVRSKIKHMKDKGRLPFANRPHATREWY